MDSECKPRGRRLIRAWARGFLDPGPESRLTAGFRVWGFAVWGFRVWGFRVRV